MLAVFAFAGAAAQDAFALPSGNTAQQWKKIAEDTVVGTPGMFQVEGFQYIAYMQAAVYEAMVAIERGYEPGAESTTAAQPWQASSSDAKSPDRTSATPSTDTACEQALRLDASCGAGHS